MIVRTWHGCVPIAYAQDFAVHLEKTGVQHAQRIEGNIAAQVKRVSQGDWEHYFLLTCWKDIEAVKVFAGENYSVAVTYPDDEHFQLLSDPYVFHHHVDQITIL